MLQSMGSQRVGHHLATEQQHALGDFLQPSENRECVGQVKGKDQEV